MPRLLTPTQRAIAAAVLALCAAQAADQTQPGQGNADGSEFAEFNFGGNGTTDAWGAAGATS
jgi:hypothetical protein